MKVTSTRNVSLKIDSLSAVLKGISEDGGLFIPVDFPKLDLKALLKCSDYAELASKVLACFINLSEAELLEITRDAYSSFDTPAVVPIKDLGQAQILELWHGPTLAFKDMALQVLPRLMKKALDAQSDVKNIMILTATSGDTGKAALEGFCDVDRTAIVVYYPAAGVAKMQQLQMETQEGNNTCVCSVDGNFDDAQTGVKKLFADHDFIKKMKENGYSLSSANSINFGRLVPQVAYYIFSYVDCVRRGKISIGDSINICVPTGNFGNILAAYYAKKMGLPIKTLICASNKNNILTDFFNTGIYDVNRVFYKTMSPSMDILISSNLERLLFEMVNRDDEKLTALMESLKNTGKFELSKDEMEYVRNDFYAGFASEEQTAQAIQYEYKDNGYLCDTHTAVAMHVFRSYVDKTQDSTLTVIASTACPYKFTPDVLSSISGFNSGDAFCDAKELATITGIPVPKQICDLKEKPILHNRFVDRDSMGKVALEFAERKNGR